jgi:hypothetical protein
MFPVEALCHLLNLSRNEIRTHRQSRSERHGIGSLAPFADVLPFELFDSVDVA